MGTHLQNALHAIKREESAEWFDPFEPNYSPQAVEAFTSATRMLQQVGDQRLLAAFIDGLGEDSPLLEYVQPAMEHAQAEGHFEAWRLGQAQEEARLGERQKMLETEYRDIERRTGKAGLEAADQLAQRLDLEGLLYDQHADEFLLRGQMRQIAESAKATERGAKAANFLTEFDREAARIAGPGSSWSDAERERWETEMRNGTVGVVERAFGDSNEHADRAVDSMYLDDRRRALGKGVFEERLDGELARMAEHDSRAEHKKALASEDAEEFRQTHDSTGRSTVEYDGLGREHGGRYE